MSAPLGFIEPQLLTSVDQPPQGDEWLHEIKHDGYRTLVVVDGGDARA
jgi:bifunctional non-homologous end joining protein LigD